MFRLFKEKQKNKKKVEIHNRLIDIRIGRKYARGIDMNGNTYECFNNTAEEAYHRFIEISNDLKDVNMLYFKEGYDLQTKELALVIKTNAISK